MRTITTSELKADMQDKYMVLLDVRTAQEYAGGYIKGARLFPLDRIHTYEGKKGSTIYLICHSGTRSKRAAKLLSQKAMMRFRSKVAWWLGKEKSLEERND